MNSKSSIAKTVTNLPTSISTEEREAQDVIKQIVDAQERGRNTIKINGILSSNLKKELKCKNYEINELVTIRKKMSESSELDSDSYKYINVKYRKCWIEMCCYIPLCVCPDDDVNPPFTTIKWKISDNQDVDLTFLPPSAPPAYKMDD